MSAEQFTWPIRVYYEDTDASGVTYHANYLRWFERARTEWLRARQLGQEVLRTEFGIAFTIANLDIDFLRPARMDDEVVVLTKVAGARRASLTFSQELRRPSSGNELLARASVRVACVDAASFRPKPLPGAMFSSASGEAPASG